MKKPTELWNQITAKYNDNKYFYPQAIKYCIINKAKWRKILLVTFIYNLIFIL